VHFPRIYKWYKSTLSSLSEQNQHSQLDTENLPLTTCLHSERDFSDSHARGAYCLEYKINNRIYNCSWLQNRNILYPGHTTEPPAPGGTKITWLACISHLLAGPTIPIIGLVHFANFFNLINSITFVLFGKYCPIVDQLGSKDSSRDFQLNCVISYFLPIFNTSCKWLKIDMTEKEWKT
jgi:hypothetical protein